MRVLLYIYSLLFLNRGTYKLSFSTGNKLERKIVSSITKNGTIKCLLLTLAACGFS